MTIHRHQRQGITAVLAMLYLVLFSALAIGFYTAANTNIAVVENDKRITQAMMAAESGMDFLRFQLAQVEIPYGTTQAQLFSTICDSMETQLEGTGNLGSRAISVTEDLIKIPADDNEYIALDSSGMKFRATVENLGQKVRVKVVGKYGDITIRRAIQMDYDLAEKASAIFDYGVASKGKITTAGASRIKGATDPKKGSVLSTCLTDPTPVQIAGKEVSGDISITNPNGNVTFSGASIGGSTDAGDIIANHIHKGVPEPEFPTIDTDMFLPFVTNADGTRNYYVSGKNLNNMVIRANTNPKFIGGANITGVVYVEAPNNIEFRGNCVIQGLIVVQNNAPGTLASNVLNFSGNVTAAGVNTLPESYGALRQLTGSFLLAPKFQVMFSGNFGTVNGSIISDKVSMTGNAQGTVMGSVINMADQTMTVNGSAEIIIASTGTTDYPAGVFFSSRYVPLPDTYEEVQP